jgi:hypothetical protein
MLAQRYNTTNLAQRFQIVTKLNHMHQEPGQNIVDVYSQMTYLWNQLSFVIHNGSIELMHPDTSLFVIACALSSFLWQFRMSLSILELLFFIAPCCHPWKVL